MARKSVIRRIYKYLPKSVAKQQEFQRIDNAIKLMNENFEASNTQLMYIQSLLQNSALPEHEKETIERNLPELNSSQAADTIDKLEQSQVDMVEAGANYGNAEIQKTLDKRLKRDNDPELFNPQK
jgi:hypothetical protein